MHNPGRGDEEGNHGKFFQKVLFSSDKGGKKQGILGGEFFFEVRWGKCSMKKGKLLIARMKASTA